MNYRILSCFFLFFLVLQSAPAQNFYFPVFKEQAGECETGEDAFSKYGLNRVLLEWDAENITERMCEQIAVEGKSGYFCDASQFSIMLSKRIEIYKQSAQELVKYLSEEEKQGLLSLQALSEFGEITGFDADFEALLLKDNYSERFRKDFDSRYGGLFLGKRIEISEWAFENSPGQAGLYNIFVESPISFDGEAFEFSTTLSIRFELIEPLESLDERIETFFQKNWLLKIPFDAGVGSAERDYGSSSAGEGVQLNDSTFFSNASGAVASLETARGSSYNDTASGLVFGLGKIEGENSFSLKFNHSIPVQLSLNLLEDRFYNIYYSIGGSFGEAMPESFFGERDNLLDWSTEDILVSDFFPVKSPSIECSGWSEDIDSAALEIASPGQDYLGYSSLAFLPKGSSFTVQCVSDDLNVSMRSYDGEKFGYGKSISPFPNKWLGGMRGMLKPTQWQGIFSLKDAVEEVKKGNMCVIADNDFIVLAWNKDLFKEDLIEAEYWETGEIDDLCRLRRGDVHNISGMDLERDKALYWCRQWEQCDSEQGYRFSGKAWDPCNGSDIYCCYKPMSESERQCLKEEMEIYPVLQETPSPEFIEEIIKAWPESRAGILEESDLEEIGIGEAFIEFNMDGWTHVLGDGTEFTKEKRFDPLILLAFFSYESQMGTDNSFDASRKSIGNIEIKTGGQGLKQSTLCTNPNFERFCGYNEWWESVRHWAWLIEENYVSEGKETVRDILYKYAPSTENNTEEYIAAVKRRVCHWRELWKEHAERESEEGAIAAQIEMPDWLVGIIAGIAKPFQNLVKFWEKDSDSDGIIDLKDKCPNKRETFNRYKDKDGCPDAAEKRNLEKSGELKTSNRSQSIRSSPKSIYNKKVILFVPIDFQHSESKKFKKNAKNYFDKFLEVSGLESLSGNSIILVVDDVLEYQSVKPCNALRTERARYSMSGERKIVGISKFRKTLDACGKNYLRKKYGFLPPYSDYRVVALIDSKETFWYFGKRQLGSVKGLSWFSGRGPINSVISADYWVTVSHELGHTFGFSEQFSSRTYLKTVANYNYVKNYYPGPLQQYYNLEREGASVLYTKGYVKGTSKYPVCSYNKGALKTNCPERLGGGAIDCLGRKLPKTGMLEKRSVMGPLSTVNLLVLRFQARDYGFDCFELEEIQKQWGR